MKSKPDQNYWSQFLSLPVWQLVVLSLNIEPRSLSRSEVYEGEFHGWPNAEKKQAYIERLNIALNHIECGNLNPGNLQRYRYPYIQPTQVSKFISWSQSLKVKWEIPTWLSDLILKSEQQQRLKEPNTKEENTWTRLLEVVLTMDPLDYSQPYVAAKIIEAQAKSKGIQLSEGTIADKIKKILLLAK